jgi:hypothetical protein
MNSNSISNIPAYQSGSSVQSAKPTKPAAPTPPPGGNVENRQAPSEPSAPTQSNGGSYGVNFDALRTMQSIVRDYNGCS